MTLAVIAGRIRFRAAQQLGRVRFSKDLGRSMSVSDMRKRRVSVPAVKPVSAKVQSEHDARVPTHVTVFNVTFKVVSAAVEFLLYLIPNVLKQKVADFITNQRYVFICLILLPISIVYDLFLATRRFYLYNVKNSRSTSSHNQRVELIRKQVLAAPEGVPMCTARPVWFAMSLKEAVYKRSMVQIDVSDLDNVLEIDEVNKVVRVEPNCTMGQITRELIPRGWTMAVVPELDDLTVGGLIMGFGIETSSHKFGLFQHTCTAFEVVLPNGDVIRASQTENPDLFAALPWSHGTIGFLVSAEIKIVPALPYVHLTYIPCDSLSSMVNTFTLASQSPAFDFVEMLTYSKSSAVVMVGKMSDYEGIKNLNEQNLAAVPTINAIGDHWKPWFFTHVKSFLTASGEQDEDSEYRNANALEFLTTLYSKGTVDLSNGEIDPSQLRQELIPLRHYYHRHTRSLFWELQDLIPFGNEPWFRYLLGWAVPPHISLMKLTTTEKLREIYEKAHVVQDMLVPINTLKESILKFHREMAIYPLWICPMRLLSPPSDVWGESTPADMDDPASLEELKSKFSPDSSLLQPHKFEDTCDVGGLCAPTPSEQLYVDIGAYGVPQAPQWHDAVRKIYGETAIPNRGLELSEDADEFEPESSYNTTEELHIQVMRRVEDFVRKNHGYQALYADCFQTREEFREMFDHRLYDQLRKKYGSEGRLPTIYDKISRQARR